MNVFGVCVMVCVFTGTGDFFQKRLPRTVLIRIDVVEDQLGVVVLLIFDMST